MVTEFRSKRVMVDGALFIVREPSAADAAFISKHRDNLIAAYVVRLLRYQATEERVYQDSQLQTVSEMPMRVLQPVFEAATALAAGTDSPNS